MAQFAEFLDETDTLVKDYLLFRGFTSSFNEFNREREQDRVHKFNVEKIVQQIRSYVSSFDADGLTELWSFLKQHFFSTLDGDYSHVISKLETSLTCYYLVNAVKSKENDRAIAFLKQQAKILTKSALNNLRDWFSLPYVQNPREDPVFQRYFRKSWEEFFLISLSNFLVTVFQNLPPPPLLAFKIRRLKTNALVAELHSCNAERARLGTRVVAMEKEIRMLRQRCNAIESYHQQCLDKAMEPRRAADSLFGADDEEIAALAARRDSMMSPDSPITETPFHVDNLQYKSVTSPTPPLQTLTEQAGPNPRCKFSGRGRFLAAGGESATLQVWSVRTGKTIEASLLKSVMCSHQILSLEWSADEKLFVGTSAQLIKMWSSSSQRFVSDFKCDSAFPLVVDMKSSPQAATLAASLAESPVTVSTLGQPDTRHPGGKLNVWDIKTNKVLQTLPLGPDPIQVNSVAFNHNGSIVLGGAVDGTVRLFDLHSATVFAQWKATKGAAILYVGFAEPNFDSVITASADGKLVEWSFRSPGQKVREWEPFGSTTAPYNAARFDFAYRGDSKHFTTTSSGVAVPIYSAKSGSCVQRLRSTRSSGSILSVDWHPTSDLVRPENNASNGTYDNAKIHLFIDDRTSMILPFKQSNWVNSILLSRLCLV